MAIHIKPSHKGKFTEYKKKTGKTTEEALHSKDAHVRKMAQFAKNASKWHHGDGGKATMQTGFFPQNSDTPYDQRGADSTDFSQLLASNPQMATYIYNQYKQLANDPKSGVKENAQAVINAYDAALNVGGKNNPSTNTLPAFDSQLPQPKIGFKKKMANGGVTQSTRDNYESAMGWMSQQGYNTNDPKLNHNASLGNSYLSDYNKSVGATSGKQFDPRDVPAMQAYFLANQGTNKVRNTAGAFSPIDAFPGTQTLNSRQMTYQTQDSKGNVQNFGTNGDAASAVVNGWKDQGWEGFGDPKSDINYKAPQATWTSNDQGVPMAQEQKSNWHTNESTDYSVDAVRAGDGTLINPFKGAKPVIPIERLYKTPLGQKIWAPTMPTGPLKKRFGGRVYGDGSVTPDDIGGARMGDIDPSIKSAVAPQDSFIPPPIQASAPPTTNPGTPTQTTHNYTGFSTKGLITAGLAGADALVTNFITNPKVKAQEAQMQRNLINPVGSPNDFYGHGMGMYAKGGQIDSHFETNPGNSNALVESKEMLQLPDGSTVPVTGQEFHNDRSDGLGGKYMNLPGNTRVFSEKLKLDKDFASDIMDKKITKKMSPAQLAKKFQTDKEDDILNNRASDPVALRTAQLTKSIKGDNLDAIFQQQEFVKDPEGTARMMFGGTLLAGFGGQIYGDGGVRADQNDGSILDYQKWLMQNRPDDVNRATTTLGMPNAGRFDDGLDGPRTRMTQAMQSGYGADSIPRLQQSLYRPSQTSPDEAAGLEIMPTNPHQVNIGPGADMDYREPLQPVNVPEIPDFTGGARGKFKPKLSGNLGDAASYIPEAIASIHAMTNYPIFGAKFQPKYVGVNEVNVQADLNRNLSMGYPAMQRSIGNAGVDAARRGSTLATLIDSANQIGQYKANYDASQRVQRDTTNVGIENSANMKNLELMDTMANKMTQRQFNKERSVDNIAQSVFNKSYAINHGRALERNSLSILNKMYPNWQYNQQQGLTPQGNEPWVHTPYGYLPGGMGMGAFEPGDGIRGTETIKVGNKTYKLQENTNN